MPRHLDIIDTQYSSAGDTLTVTFQGDPVLLQKVESLCQRAYFSIPATATFNTNQTTLELTVNQVRRLLDVQPTMGDPVYYTAPLKALSMVLGELNSTLFATGHPHSLKFPLLQVTGEWVPQGNNTYSSHVVAQPDPSRSMPIADDLAMGLIDFVGEQFKKGRKAGKAGLDVEHYPFRAVPATGSIKTGDIRVTFARSLIAMPVTHPGHALNGMKHSFDNTIQQIATEYGAQFEPVKAFIGPSVSAPQSLSQPTLPGGFRPTGTGTAAGGVGFP